MKQKTIINEYVEVFKKNNFKVTTIYDHGFNVVVNDLQDIFIRPLNSKSYASLTPNSKVFKDIYIEEKYRRKEIGFSANKEPQKLFDDINKRLITSEFSIEQYNVLFQRQSQNNQYLKEQNNVKTQIESITLDLRLNESCEEFSLYHEKAYGKVKYYRDSMTINISSLPVELGIKILKLLENENV